MTRYTYTQYYQADRNYRSGYTDRVVVPDQVYENQKAYDGKSFPAFCSRERKVIVTLIGDDYDLHGSGTGDMCVRPGRISHV